MRKFFILILFVAGAYSANAQLKVGPQIGVPVGENSDFYSLVWGADAYYMFGDPDAFLNFGAATGFFNFVGDDVDILGTTTEIDNAQFLPVAGAVRLVILSTLSAGADIGYGIGLNDGNDGGFYWRLNAGLDLGNTIELNAFYYGITADGADGGNSTLGTVGLNLLFEFGR